MAELYSRRIETNSHNALYDRPNTLAMLPDVEGKSVLDAACGPGKYAQELIAQGAKVTGFDLSPKMIELAKQRNQDAGHFFVHDFSQPFNMLEKQSFDFVLCALALHYLEDWTTTICEFARVLKPKGQLVLSIEHPFFEYQYFKSEHYFGVEPVNCLWKSFGDDAMVHSYRRSLEGCLAPLCNNGFYIDAIKEPRPLPEMKESDPKHFAELNDFPAFLCVRAVKRGE